MHHNVLFSTLDCPTLYQYCQKVTAKQGLPTAETKALTDKGNLPPGNLPGLQEQENHTSSSPQGAHILQPWLAH